MQHLTYPEFVGIAYIISEVHHQNWGRFFPPYFLVGLLSALVVTLYVLAPFFLCSNATKSLKTLPWGVQEIKHILWTCQIQFQLSEKTRLDFFAVNFKAFKEPLLGRRFIKWEPCFFTIGYGRHANSKKIPATWYQTKLQSFKIAMAADLYSRLWCVHLGEKLYSFTSVGMVGGHGIAQRVHGCERSFSY